MTTTVPFELDIVMETGLFSTVMSVSGERLNSALERREKNFDLRFENTFHLKEKVREGEGGRGRSEILSSGSGIQ